MPVAEVLTKKVQLAPKRRKNQHRAAEAQTKKVQVAPKRKRLRKNLELAAEAVVNNSAGCTKNKKDTKTKNRQALSALPVFLFDDRICELLRT